MRNTGFIAVIVVLLVIQIAPRIYKNIEKSQEEREQKKREYRSKQIHYAVQESQKSVAAMQRYSELREKERVSSLSFDERTELDRITDELGYWFERQGEKLTKRYGLQRFNRDEIDALVGLK